MSYITTWYARVVRLYTLNSPVLYGIIFLLFFIKSFFSLDPDFGWHISSGQYILEHGVPRHDIYSYTMPTFSWIHHEWLADLANYLVYHYFGGYFALAVIYAAMWTAAVWLLARSTKHRLLVLFVVTLLLPFAGVRAITWTALLSSVLIVFCRTKRATLIYLTPLVMLLWANVHGSFVIGILYLLWRLVIKPRWINVLLLIVSVAATFVTPYGAGMYVEVVRTATDVTLHTNISEWRPLQPGIGVGIFAGIWMAVCILGSTGVFWKRFVRFETLLLVMSFSSSRHTVLFLLFALPTLLRGVNAFPLPIKTIPVKRLAIGLVGLLVVVSGLLVVTTFMHVSLNREATYPSAIAASLRITPCAGNVFAHYNYAGYLIWKVPGEKLFIDGRMPSWSAAGQNAMADYIRVTKDGSYRAKEFARFNIRCVVWNRSDTFAKTLHQEGWSVAESEKNGTVLLRR